ncbi:hypothetical protein Tco_1566620 [Tanacetum coccineum]
MILSRTGSNINLDGARNVPMGGGLDNKEFVGKPAYLYQCFPTVLKQIRRLFPRVQRPKCSRTRQSDLKDYGDDRGL